jgi:hypothetical protein
MKRSEINPLPEYFDRYINLVADTELLDAFDASIEQINKLDRDLYTALGEKLYAPGKWTVKDIIQHIIDTERILTYRALRFARNDETPLPGFEESTLSMHTRANERSIVSLFDELLLVRRTTKIMFENFNTEMLLRNGTASGKKISVLALGFTIIGHQLHHLKIIEERYVPLVK